MTETFMCVESRIRPLLYNLEADICDRVRRHVVSLSMGFDCPGEKIFQNTASFPSFYLLAAQFNTLDQKKQLRCGIITWNIDRIEFEGLCLHWEPLHCFEASWEYYTEIFLSPAFLYAVFWRWMPIKGFEQLVAKRVPLVETLREGVFVSFFQEAFNWIFEELIKRPSRCTAGYIYLFIKTGWLLS